MKKQAFLVVLAPIALLTALLSWAWASPVGASPDDDFHMASIWCGQGLRDGLCEAGDTPAERRVPAPLVYSSPCFAFNSEASAACDLPSSDVLVATTHGNFDETKTKLYPPVFYAVMSAFASQDISASILMMRTFNAVLFVGATTALFLLLRRGSRGPLIWGSLAAMIPLGIFLVPSVNPSSWAIASAVTVWIAMLGYWSETSLRRRVALGVVAGVMTIVGGGARGDAAVFAGIAIVVAFILTFDRTRLTSKPFLWSLVLPAALAVVSVLFFLSARQSGVADPGTIEDGGTLGSALGLTLANLVLLPQLWVGVLGTWGLGWLDTLLPGSVWVSMIVVFGALLFWGIQRLGARKAISLGIVFVCLTVIPLYVLAGMDATVGSQVQPRYILPLMIMLVGIALVGFGDDLAATTVQLSGIAILLIVANAVALHVNIRRYVTGTDVNGPNLDANIEWWWPGAISPMAIWLIGSLAFAGVVTLALRYSLAYRRESLDAILPATTTGPPFLR